MVDPFSAGAVAATGWAGRKVLGPVLDEIGQDLRERYSERRQRNFVRIGQRAQKKLGSRVDEPGSVPPRVALRLLDEGSWCDASIMAEYFGGILAASRSPEGDDDRGVTWAGLVSRLSTDDVFLHYLIYDSIRRVHLGAEFNIGEQEGRAKAMTYLPAGNTLEAMGLEPTSGNWGRRVVPALTSLLRESLIDPSEYRWGPVDALGAKAPGAEDAGMLIRPSAAGAQLFFWAHGFGDRSHHELLDAAIVLEPAEPIPSVAGARSIAEMKATHAAAEKARREAAESPE